ncbi:MAG: MFS transporter [Candidatus Saccharibacteria bacterium]|nr:MFS transporter [Candidatus Saccharibacteria bacterium]
MLKKLIHKVLRHRHFWRDATFDELSEVYIAMAFRSFALGMIGIFVPVYILTLGYGISTVALFYAVYFLCRIFLDFAAAYVIARFGPKHTLFIGYVVQILAAGSFSLVGAIGFPLYLSALIWGAASSLTFTSLHVDFSKIKHSDHGGKEVGYLNILQRVGGMIGPLIGGVVATLFNPELLFATAVLVLLLGLLPLFKTAEPVKTRQKLAFRELRVDKIKRDFLSVSFLYVENNLRVVLWPAFLTLFVFAENIYGTIGILASLGFFTSITAAYFAGKLVDSQKGWLLLRVTSIANAFVYGLRPFAQSVVGVLGINVISDSLTVAYRIPFKKGFYDAADQHPGLRIVYITSVEAFGSLIKSVVWVQLFLLTYVLSTYQVIVAGFIIAGVCSILMNTQRFTALKRTDNGR